MTLTATTIKQSYNGDGATTSFPVGFVFWDADDVRVILTDATGTDTEWTRGTQFALPDGDGGTETLTVNTLPTDYTPASGTKLTILSNLPDTQGTSIPLGGAFPSTAIEQRLDQITRLIQQRSEELDRTPKFGASEASSSYGDMPALSGRKSKFLAFDASGVPVAAAGTSADLGPVTPFVDTLLDDTTAAAFRTTLEFPDTSTPVTEDAAQTLTNKTLTSPTVNGGTVNATTLQQGGVQAVTETGTQTLTNKTLTAPVIATVVNTGTLTLPTSTDTLVGRATTDTLTNKTLTSPVINSATGIGQAVIKRKTADESVTSSTTLQNDDHLTFSIGASEEWIGVMYINAENALATTGFRIAITTPSGASQNGWVSYISVGGTVGSARSASSGGLIFDIGAGVISGLTADIVVKFWVSNSTNAGSVTLQWAQGASSGTALTFAQGSYLLAHRIA